MLLSNGGLQGGSVHIHTSSVDRHHDNELAIMWRWGTGPSHSPSLHTLSVHRRLVGTWLHYSNLLQPVSLSIPVLELFFLIPDLLAHNIHSPPSELGPDSCPHNQGSLP
ncbi:UNVERIFIED_CONTAM: hypothetical protein K2H54_062614 [Gekko kuhli]